MREFLRAQLAYNAKNQKSEIDLTDDYMSWVQQSNLPPLTNTQHTFAKWLLMEDSQKQIDKIGNLDVIFSSVRDWVKFKKP